MSKKNQSIRGSLFNALCKGYMALKLDAIIIRIRVVEKYLEYEEKGFRAFTVAHHSGRGE